MKFFNSKKKQSQQQAKEAALLSGDGASSVAASSTGSGNSTDGKMQWDKIYVEIDNDANGTVTAPGSPTVRRSGGRTTNVYIGGSASSAYASASTAESNSMIDSATNVNSTFESKSYTIMDDDYTNVTPCLSNVNSGTVGSGGVLTRKTFGSSQEESGTIVEEEDRTINVDNMPDHHGFGGDEETHAEEYSITKNGKYLSNNHFASAQLMRWKHAAEEGPAFIQVLTFLASIAALVSTWYPVVTENEYWNISMGICAFHTSMLCVLIIVFEIRVWGARNPMSLRARIRNILVRYLNVLRLVWGRGFLYIFAGSMNLTIDYVPYTYYTGCTLLGLGILSILMGAYASFNLERLRLSLTDHSFLWSKFVEADSDNDHLIGISDFSNLVWSLGLELDDAYTYRAFSEIDQDADSRINFAEFKAWWIASQDGDETILTMDMMSSLVSKVSTKKKTKSKSKSKSNSNSNNNNNKSIPNHISV